MKKIKNQNIKVAWLGLGKIGLPMAICLLNNGYKVIGIANDSHNKKGAEILKKHGGTIQSIVDITLKECGILALCLPHPLNVINFIEKYKDFLPDTILDFSTGCPENINKYSSTTLKNFNFIDIPISGSIQDCYNGTLTLFIGANEESIYKQGLYPFISSLGVNLFFCGSRGNGYVIKLINQFMHLSIMGLIRSALLLADKLEVEQKVTLEAITKSSGGSRMLDRFGKDIINNIFEPHFTLELACKDLKLLKRLLSNSNYSDAYFSLTQKIYNKAMNYDSAGKNFSIICQDALKKFNE